MEVFCWPALGSSSEILLSVCKIFVYPQYAFCPKSFFCIFVVVVLSSLVFTSEVIFLVIPQPPTPNSLPHFWGFWNLFFFHYVLYVVLMSLCTVWNCKLLCHVLWLCFCGNCSSSAGMFCSTSISPSALSLIMLYSPTTDPRQLSAGSSRDTSAPVSFVVFCHLSSSTIGKGQTPPSLSCCPQISLLRLLMRTSGLFWASGAFMFIWHLLASSVSSHTDVDIV